MKNERNDVMTKRKALVKLTVLCLVLLIIFIYFILQFSFAYTARGHRMNIERLVEKRYFSSGSNYDYESYAYYPLYDENDRLAYCLIEFAPSGYVYVMINKTDQRGLGIFWSHSMYVRCDGPRWWRYRFSEIISSEKIYENDENGDVISFGCSHFAAADIGDEKRYLLHVSDHDDTGFVPAVKRNGRYLDLVSLDYINLDLTTDGASPATANISFQWGSAL